MPYVLYVQNPPATFPTPVASQDVYANPLTLLTALGSGGGGGVPPSAAPVPAVVGTPTSTSITVTFDTAGITGTAPISYTLTYSTGGGVPTTVDTTNVGTVYTGTASGLTPNTSYDFVANAKNAAGTVDSSPVPVSTAPVVPTPIGNLPAVQFTTASVSSISVYIDTAAVTGTLPIVYSARYTSTSGVSSPQFFDQGASFQPSTGTTIQTCTVAQGASQDISPNTVYYWGVIAGNSAGQVSTIAPFPAYSTLAAPGPVGPLAPAPPIINSVSTTTANFSFTVPAQTTPAPGPEYSIFVAPTPTNVEANAVFDSFYAATLLASTFTVEGGPFNPNTIYYAMTKASQLISSVNFQISSSVTAFSTLAASPPPLAPSAPQLTTATTDSLSFLFSTPTQTTPAPGPQYGYYGGPSPVNLVDTAIFAVNSGGPTLLASTFTGQNNITLSTNTTYYIMATAAQTIDGISYIISSPVTAMSTLAAVTPSTLIAPTAPVFIDASISSFALSFSTFLNPPEIATPAQYFVYGNTSPTNIQTNPNFTLRIPDANAVSSYTISTDYQGAVLSTNTVYYTLTQIQSSDVPITYASSSVIAMSTLTGPPPPAPTTVSTLIGVGFLTFGTGGFSSIVLDTSQNAQIGNWQADGVITYGATPPNTGDQYLSSVKGRGSKLILSLGGASSSTPVLSTMFGLDSGGNFDTGAANLANSLAYAYFGGPSDLNPLGFGRAGFGGFTFDGLDLDLEATTPSTTTLQVFVSTLKGNPGFAGKIITAAPQTPYLTQGSTSGLNANGTFQSFSEMNPASVLNAVYTGNAGNQTSLLSPTSGNLIDIQFIQAYNNASYSYPTGSTAANWNNVVAAWGIQSLQSGYPGKHPKNIYGFATTDGTPLFDESGDAEAFNISLSTANSTIRAFSTTAGVLPYSSVTVADWCAGIGFWAANTVTTTGGSSLPVLSSMYGQASTLNNMPTDVCMTYGGVFNSDPWGLIGGVTLPIQNARGY